MPATTLQPQPNQMIVTLESGAVVADIRRAVKLMRGVQSVRIATPAERTLTPALRRKISKARAEHRKGETIACRTPEEMQRYFDSL